MNNYEIFKNVFNEYKTNFNNTLFNNDITTGVVYEVAKTSIVNYV